MKKLWLVVLFLIICFPSYVLGAACTNEQKERYEALAKEIQTTLDYEEVDGDILFTINFHNVYKDLYLVDFDSATSLMIYPNDSSDVTSLVTVSNAKANTTYTFSVLNDDTSCDTRIITRIKVTTPSYNKYYTDSLCEGIQAYSLCQKWSSIGNLSYSEFQKNVQNYRNQLESNQSNSIIPDTDNLLNFRNFIANNYIYIIAVISIITFIVIMLIKKRRRSDW